MEGLSSDFAGMLPGRVITTDEICPIHHEPMLKLGWEKNSHPFCVACKREQIKQQETERLSNLQEQLFWRRTKKVLTKDSIFDDPDLQDATFANFEPNSDESKTNWNLARHLAGQYLDPKQTFNTIFTGVPGRGKSHLALSMLKAVNDNGERPMSCLFVSVNELFRLIRDSFNYPDSKYTEARMVSLLSGVDLLVLDDLGSEASFRRDTREASEFVQGILFGILNQRHRTIITTNLNSDQLSTIYNPKIISRMYKGIKGHIISFTESTPDRREISF